MLFYFLVCVAAFAIITVGMVWYARFMFTKIYGETRAQIDSITTGGEVPPEWEERLVKSPEKYKRFVDRRLGDYIIFMKNTSMVGSEAERKACLERLETFRREYPLTLEGKNK